MTENPHNEIEIPEEVPDFGFLLHQIRMFHGMTITKLSSKLGLPPQQISAIEASKKDLPPENILINWLNLLGLNKVQCKKVVLLSREYRVRHWITLNRNESANPDIVRLLDSYRLNKLTDFDRTLLRIVCR